MHVSSLAMPVIAQATECDDSSDAGRGVKRKRCSFDDEDDCFPTDIDTPSDEEYLAMNSHAATELRNTDTDPRSSPPSTVRSGNYGGSTVPVTQQVPPSGSSTTTTTSPSPSGSSSSEEKPELPYVQGATCGKRQKMIITRAQWEAKVKQVTDTAKEQHSFRDKKNHVNPDELKSIMRDRFVTVKIQELKPDYPGKKYPQLKTIARKIWGRMTPEAREEAAKRASLIIESKDPTVTPTIRFRKNNLSGKHGKYKDEDGNTLAPSHLVWLAREKRLGWQLTFHLQSLSDNKDVCARTQRLKATDPEKSAHFEKLVEELWAVPAVNEMCTRLYAFILDRVKNVSGLSELTQDFEINLNGEKEGCFHSHVILSSIKFGSPVSLGSYADWQYQGDTYDLQCCNAGGRGAAKSVQQLHGYGQVRKIGRMHGYTDYPKCQEFVLGARAIMGWWKLGKITYENAKLEVLQNRDNIAKSLQELEFAESKEDECQEEEIRSKDVACILATMKGFKTFPEIERWKEQYLYENRYNRGRRKFLVLLGDSCTGKTTLAMSLYGQETSFKCTCLPNKEPSISGFNRKKHKAIVYDECTYLHVVAFKEMFQANINKVDIQTSNTNCYKKQKYLFSVPMIVCTNDWPLVEEDAGIHWQWLQENSVVLHVKEKVFYEE